ncbi:hypothetical protein T265_10798 [Opisthorchis viverrini]|uniref:Uncharacterized protein n=1 Tax=Opisthorchis viverrini TaxID=6198 RepID=A0A074Z5C2_OPIVI|nr:hypothetical protein T265_10798 [Opisthorchis viverrini]KER20722.1 hypothetical protein T265_10798 [Opisthorchis viverrini]
MFVSLVLCSMSRPLDSGFAYDVWTGAKLIVTSSRNFRRLQKTVLPSFRVACVIPKARNWMSLQSQYFFPKKRVKSLTPISTPKLFNSRHSLIGSIYNRWRPDICTTDICTTVFINTICTIYSTLSF